MPSNKNKALPHEAGRALFNKSIIAQNFKDIKTAHSAGIIV